MVPLFGLAPGGVFPATDVTTRAVRSYRTISPLPALPDLPETLRRYVFCGTFRELAPPRRYLAPCPVEPGLSSAFAYSGCLADSAGDYTPKQPGMSADAALFIHSSPAGWWPARRSPCA